MAGIVVFGGTIEGRLIAEAFQNTKLDIFISVATEYGASLLPNSPNIHVHTGRMDQMEMEQFLKELDTEYCLDATHPYAVEVTRNIEQACKNLSLKYIRILRKEGNLDSENEGNVYYKDSIEEAVQFLNECTGNIFITTGSRDLEQYTKIKHYQNRCFARVLPTVSVVEKCKSLGFEGKNLIGMQGPFGEELNYWMLKQIHASWMVTKNSGKAGGYQEKCEAALRAGANIIVIGRKEETNHQVMELSEVIEKLKKQYGIRKKRKVYLVGMGPGNSDLLTMEAQSALEESDVLIGADRILKIWPNYEKKPFYRCYRKDEIKKFLEEHPQYETAAIVYSGDIGFYSGAKGMKEFLDDYEVHPVSGISSIPWFLNRIGVPWDQTCMVSCHGQERNMLPLIRENRYVCTLLGQKDTVESICRQLIGNGMEDVRVVVGERLSYPEERIAAGTAKQFVNQTFDALSVVLFKNPKPNQRKLILGIADETFVRGQVPMTKEEIRILSVAKMHLDRDSIVYDVGAGTGSISIEMALWCQEGCVYAVEKKKEAVLLIEKNKKRFHADCLEIVEGAAPECLESLPAPTHAFIGGSTGKIIDIIEEIRRKNPDVRFVVNTVTLETLGQLEQIRKKIPEYEDMEIVQINVAKAKKMGRYHLMSAQNPVYIASFGGRKGERHEE